MKKWIILFLVFPATLFSQRRFVKNDFWVTTSTTTPDTVYSDSLYIGNFHKASFSVVYDEADTTGTVSAVVTFWVHDGTEWIAIYLHDSTGSDSPISNFSFTADGSKIVAMPYDMTARYFRMRAIVTGADSVETATFRGTAYLQGL